MCPLLEKGQESQPKLGPGKAEPRFYVPSAVTPACLPGSLCWEAWEISPLAPEHCPRALWEPREEEPESHTTVLPLSPKFLHLQ
jgi:hypothetical protein